MSDTQPPKSNTRVLLAQLASGASELKPVEFAFKQMRSLRGFTPAVPSGAATRFGNLTTLAAAADHIADSADAIRVLLVQELLGQVTVAPGTAWSPALGVGASTVNLGGVACLIAAHSGSAIAAASTATQPSIANRSAEIVGQSNYPGLFFLLACGLPWSKAIDQIRWTCVIADAVSDVVGSIVHPIKHALKVPRPGNFGGPGCDLLPTPLYSALPGGHATLCYAMATLLPALNGSLPLTAMAAGISANREIAGLHSCIDTLTGEVLGKAIGNWLIAAAQNPATPCWRDVFMLAQAEW